MNCAYCGKDITGANQVKPEMWGEMAFCSWDCVESYGRKEVRTKVMTVCGTRPELIRLSEIIKKLDKCVDHVLVHTGQSYDYELNQIFFDELKIRKPDYLLDVKSETVGEQIGKILTQTEAVMIKEKPDAVLILGDTNSALTCIIAKRLKIPIFHMEAGNRCFDYRVPEEINRRIVDHCSDINLCYTEHARRNLLDEGLPTQNIFVTGSPLPEVYRANEDGVSRSSILEKLNLERMQFILVSCHREENLENDANFKSIFKSVCILSDTYKMPVVITAHPRTQRKIEENSWQNNKWITHKPFGLHDFLKLEQTAFVTLSDSGTASEDSAIFSIPMVVIRDSIERPESQDCGNIIQSGVDVENIIEAVRLARMQVDNKIEFRNPYGDDAISDKVVRLIVGYHKIVKKKEYHE